jgi:hypothetical protein
MQSKLPLQRQLRQQQRVSRLLVLTQHLHSSVHFSCQQGQLGRKPPQAAALLP